MDEDLEAITINAKDLSILMAMVIVDVVQAIEPDIQRADEKLIVIANSLYEFARKTPNDRYKKLLGALARALIRTEHAG